LYVALTVTIEVISEINKLDNEQSDGEDVGQQDCRDGHRELGVEFGIFNCVFYATPGTVESNGRNILGAKKI